MLDNPGVGTYVFYALLCAFLLVIVVVFLRLMVMFSLLWLVPLAALLRRVPGVRRFIPR
jgi:hypothetical protein